MKLEHNADGSVIAELEPGETVTLDGETVDRLTIPALTGKHLRSAPWGVGAGEVTLGDLSEWASRITLPVGAFDLLPAPTARDVALQCAVQLGKPRATGAKRSGTSPG